MSYLTTQNRDADGYKPATSEGAHGTSGKVDDSPPDERPAVIDAYRNGTSGALVGDQDTSSEGERLVSSANAAGVVGLAIGCPSARAVRARDAALCECGNGRCQGCDHRQ